MRGLLKTTGWRAVAFSASVLPLMAEPVVFKSVEASYLAGSPEDLKKTLDGIDSSPRGWSVAPMFDSPQSVVFATAATVEADLVSMTLFFNSGRLNASFADFALSLTTENPPSMEGHWEPLAVMGFGSTRGNLKRGEGNRLRIDGFSALYTGMIPDSIYYITGRVGGKSVTGFRIDVFPIRRAPDAGGHPVMAGSTDGDFILTEFKCDVLSSSTNVALGASVTATHPLFSWQESMKAESLVDGWPGTIAHPADDVTGKNFHFEIDLGEDRRLDHIGLRQRGDGLDLDRFGKMRVELFPSDPARDDRVSWQTLNRPDGSYPAPGEVDLLRASDGQGDFHGHYLRISTENPVPLSPQLAEVEVYETRTAGLAAIRADDRELPVGPPLRIPPGAMRLALQLDIPRRGKPPDRLFRWRLLGVKEEWQTSKSMLLEIPCPSAGESVLEVQAAHSDGTWDATVLSIPLEILEPFTESRAFFGLMAVATLSVGGLIAWVLSARRIAVLKGQAGLAAERTRIARDMHDDVGARLSQLSFLLKGLGSDPTLPDASRDEVDQIARTANEALGSLDEVVWMVNPKNDRAGPLCQHLASHAIRYLSPLGIACRIDSPPAWPEINIYAQPRHQMTMAFKEALQNVVKHSGASVVEVAMALEGGRLVIRVADNGRGLPEDVSERGRSGIGNMKARLAGIGGDCELHPRAGGGTVVEMRFPVG